MTAIENINTLEVILAAIETFNTLESLWQILGLTQVSHFFR